MVYPKYTVVAEKLHAICLLGMANTRMKDYFDLDILLAEANNGTAGRLRRMATRSSRAADQRQRLAAEAIRARWRRGKGGFELLPSVRKTSEHLCVER